MSIQQKQQHSQVQEEDQQQNLPCPSPFDALSSIFYPRPQETSRVGDSTISAGDYSLSSKLFLGLPNNTGLLEEIVKEGMKGKINPIRSMEGSSPVREIQPLLPPGYRFVPTDEELIRYYLLPFLQGYSFRNIDIHHVDIYKYNPKQLAAEFKKGNDKDEWFFITERRKKFDGGKIPDRSANGGYWKAIGIETKVDAGKGVLGFKRSLVFHTGKQPKGLKTDWIMQEYHLDHPLPPPSSNNESHGDNKMLDTVLCKIYETPMGKKRRAEEEQEEEDEDLQCPFPLDKPFNLGQQESRSRVGDSTKYLSLNPKLSEEIVKEERELTSEVSSTGKKTKTVEEEDAESLLINNTHPLAVKTIPWIDEPNLSEEIVKEEKELFLGVSPMGKKTKTEEEEEEEEDTESLLINNTHPLAVKTLPWTDKPY